MNSFAIVLILISTLMHASWNLLGKNHESVHHFFQKLLRSILLIGLLPMLIAEWRWPSLPVRALGCALGSGIFCGFYYFSLANAYRGGDFSIVYPMARAIPVVLVGFADMLLGRTPNAMGWLGMLFLVFGCLIVPLPSLRSFHWSHYRNRTQMWIWFTAFGTVGYTLLDKWASDAVPPGLLSASRYGYFLFATSALFYELLLRLSRRHRMGNLPLPGWKQPMLGAIFTFGAYGLVLWAYQLSEKAGYVVAFRQFSIVIGVVVGFFLFQEGNRAIRLFAVSLICMGLVAIGVWG